MVGPSRSQTFASALVLAALFVARAGTEARAQVFQYTYGDIGQNGAVGFAVARGGDIDGDGCEDLLVGGPKAINLGVPGSGVGIVGSGCTGSQFAWMDGVGGENLGAAIDGRIDLDGDGFPDVLIGAPLAPALLPNQGIVIAWSPHLHTGLFSVFGVVGCKFGSSVRSLQADLDGDGVDDFIVGAPGGDYVNVFSGKSGAFLFSNTGQSGSGFGTDVCRGGDLDNDGICDYLVGSPDHVDSGGTKTGRVTAFSGATGNKLWSVDGTADSRFGRSIAQPGDLDGDGQGDIVVGVPQHLDSTGNKTGCVTVLSGADHSVLYKVFGNGDGDTFGHSVRGVGGDIDNDGTVDFIVGAPQLLGSGVGYARTISGATGNTLFTYLVHTFDPTTASNYGSDVCGGDWNDDGRTDVLIGGSNFDGGDGIAETWITAVASWSNYGTGWAGTKGVPGLTARADPVVGRSLDVDLENSAGIATAGTLFFGLTEDSIKTGKGGTLLLDAFLSFPIAVPAGGLTLSGPIPDDPSLYGFHLYLQVIEADAGASKGLSFTQGLDLYFGYE